MSANSDEDQAALQRILDDSRAVSRRMLRRPETPGGARAGVDLAGPIAAIRACLDPRPAAPAATGAAARLRLTVALASLPGGERRRTPRWPIAKSGTLRLATGERPVTLLDLGSGGAKLAPVEGLPALAVQDATLVLGRDDRMTVTLATDPGRCAHLALVPSDQAFSHTLAAEMRDWAAYYELAIWQAVELANAVEQLFESVLSSGDADQAGLFDRPWPEQRDRRDAWAWRLETVLAEALTPADGLAYVIATDRDGHVAGDPMRRFGQDRLFDAVGMWAARFSNRAIVQTFRYAPGDEPAGVFADVAAPVAIRGRRWGCVRIGRDLPDAPRI